MTVYSVFARSGNPEPAVVADRFSWFAALLPPVYALAHGLWLMLAGWVVAVVALAIIAILVGADAATLLYALVAIFIGFEAATARRMKLGRRGFAYAGERIARSEDEAALLYLLDAR